MIIRLTNLDIDKIKKGLFNSGSEPCVIMYADFNVINHIYESRLEIPINFKLYPDSTAVYFILKLFVDNKVAKIVSTDLQHNLLNFLANSGKRIFLFGDSDEILNKVKITLLERKGSLQLAGFHNGYIYNEYEVIETINKSNSDVLFVGLGATRQEKWIINNYKKLNVKLIISVGGWFQYLAENKKRAPLFLRRMHLEWFYKLTKEFKSVWKRYLFGFPFFCYRVVFKKINFEILDV